MVSYFIGEDQTHLNLVFITKEQQWAEESWTARGDLATLRAAFEGWAEDLQEILGKVEDPVYKWALHDREPLPHWDLGRVTLLGDAAHPVLPFMAQGACQAIEDAYVLARCLNESDNHATAIKRYQTIRKPRTDKIQNGSWDNATTCHLPDGPEQEARDAFYLALTREDSHPLGSLDWLQGYNVLAEMNQGGTMLQRNLRARKGAITRDESDFTLGDKYFFYLPFRASPLPHFPDLARP